MGILRSNPALVFVVSLRIMILLRMSFMVRILFWALIVPIVVLRSSPDITIAYVFVVRDCIISHISCDIC